MERPEVGRGLSPDSAALPGTQQIVVSGRHYDNAIGTSDAASQGTVRAELLKSRPALQAKCSSSCRRDRHGLGLTLDVFNLLDAKVNDIQYYYESRLPGEPAPVEDRIVHPAEPRTLRPTLRAWS